MKRKDNRGKYKLNVTTNLRKTYLDYDYLEKLTPEQLNWLDRFTDEYYGGGFEKENGEFTKDNLHKTDALRKDCYNRNNAQNRCIFNRQNSLGALAELNEYYAEVEEGIRSNGLNTTQNVQDLILDIKNAKFKKSSRNRKNSSENPNTSSDKI